MNLLTIGTFALAAFTARGDMSPPFQLICNGLESPSIGVESTQPWFQWSTSSMQTAYRLIVSSVVDNSTAWDSSVVQSSEQRAVYPPCSAGVLPLNASTAYRWAVAVSADSGTTWSPWSAPGLFTTGAWATWTAAPIWHANASAGFVFLRANLSLPAGPIAYALAHATANPQGSTHGEQENSKLLAAYRLYIADQLIGMGPGRPGTCGPVCPVGNDPGMCTCPPHHVYDSYDVTGAVGSVWPGGPLTVAVQAYNTPPVQSGHPSTNRTSQVMVQLVVVYRDGSRVEAGTQADGSWEAYNADEYYSATCCTSDTGWYVQLAENADARLEPVGWRDPSFVPTPEEGWTAALTPINGTGWAGPLIARPTRPLAITQGIEPVLVQQLGPGHWFLDFGCEFQGGLRLELPPQAAPPGTAGTQLTVRLGEEMLSWSPPAVMYNMRTGNHYVHTYTLRDGPQVFEHHEYLEFRYVELLYGSATPGEQGSQCARTVAGDYSTPITLQCSAGGSAVITSLSFASWGTPSGACSTTPGVPAGTNSFAVNTSCAYAQTAQVLEKLCVGKPTCTFTPTDALFGGVDPCQYTDKYLAVSVSCTVNPPLPAPSPLPPMPNTTAWVLTYPASYIGPSQVVTSSPVLNAVWSMCQYTVVATALDMYTDSNTRQRSVICSEALHINLLMQYATSTETAMQAYTLNYTINSRPSALGWAEWQALTIMSVHAVWLHTGDLSIFTANYDHLRAFTELALVNVTGTGLWTCDGVSYDCVQPEVDWPSNMRDGFVMTPTNTVVNAYTYYAMTLFVQMAQALGGHDDDVQLYSAAATALRAAINSQLYNSSLGAYRDGLTTEHSAWHSSVYALAFGVPYAEQLPSVRQYVLARSVGQPGLCQPGNVYPAQWALEGLFSTGADYGAAGVAYMLCAGQNSWVAMLAQNATTTAEAWHAEEKPNETWSHSWAASPADIIPRFVLGIRPLLPGFRKVLIQPQLGNLSWVTGSLPTPRGPVTVSVNQSLAFSADVPQAQAVPVPVPTAFSMTFTVPGNTNATVCLPAPACAAAGGSITLDGRSVPGDGGGAYPGFQCVDNVPMGAHTAACGEEGGLP